MGPGGFCLINPDFGKPGNPDLGTSGNPDFGNPENPDFGNPGDPGFEKSVNPYFGKFRSLEIGHFEIRDPTKNKKVLRSTSVLPPNVGKVWIDRNKGLSAPCGAIPGNFLHGPKRSPKCCFCLSMLYCMAVICGFLAAL